eukprot:6875639-Pyramimonas_sp.AAC.1
MRVSGTCACETHGAQKVGATSRRTCGRLQLRGPPSRGSARGATGAAPADASTAAGGVVLPRHPEPV